MSDPNRFNDLQHRINLMDDPWLVRDENKSRYGYVSEETEPVPAPEFHAERVRISLEVNVPIVLDGDSSIEGLVTELNRVAHQNGWVTLVVNGYGMDFRVSRAYAERTER